MSEGAMTRRTQPAYRFHADTGEYAGTADADESPLEPGIFHLPAAATFDAPPPPAAGMARVWNGTAWTQVEDRRGQAVWVKATGQRGAVTGLGPIAAEFTMIEPPSPRHAWNGTAWSVDAAAQAAWLRQRRVEATRGVDGMAEAARQRYLTPGDGMALVYDAKRREAEAFSNAFYSAETSPLIAAEAARTGKTPAAIAAIWNERAAAWWRIAARIETARFDAKAALDAAADEVAIAAAMDALTAALDALPAA